MCLDIKSLHIICMSSLWLGDTSFFGLSLGPTKDIIISIGQDRLLTRLREDITISNGQAKLDKNRKV